MKPWDRLPKELGAQLVKAPVLALLFGVSTHRIRQMAEKDKLPKRGHGLYPLVECIKWRLRHLEQLARKDQSPERVDLRSRILEMDVKQRQAELAERLGETITVEEAAADLEALVARFREKLLGFYAVLAPAIGIPLHVLQRLGTPALHELMRSLAATGREVDADDDGIRRQPARQKKVPASA